MPGEGAGIQIGHYLNSRSSGSDTLTSNLTFTKTAAKSSTFMSSNDKSYETTNISKPAKPVAKPRSVYNEINKEDSRSSPTSYPLATNTNSDTPNSYPIVTVGNGGEDWGTKKRVETKTIKTIETRRQRQVVLEDGRIIEEDEPEVTVDTIEDVESNSDDGEEDRNLIGGWGGSYDASRALQNTPSTMNGGGQVTPWKPGGNILGESLKRNTYTTDVQKRSYSTTSAKNLGDIKKKDVNRIIKEGRNSKTFIRPYDDTDSSGTVNIAPKVSYKNSARRRIVDREDIQDVHRMQDGVVKTDRYVTRECVEDEGQETPEEGDSTDTESHDGDKDSYSQRKEDRFIDYYRVPKGKSVKEGKLVRHGIHLTSYDKNNAKGALDDSVTMRPAITYRSDDQSDSTSTPPRDHWSTNKKPPKPDRHLSSNRKPDTYRRSMRYSSSERERESTRSPNNEDFPVHYSTPTPTAANRFHTIERSTHVGRSKQSADQIFYGSGTIGTGADQRKPKVYHGANSHNIHRGSRGRSSDHFSDDMTSSYRSRSMSRSNQGTKSVGQESSDIPKSKAGANNSHPHHRSMGTIRKDLDTERTGRLKRAMSFSTHDRRQIPKKKSTNGEHGTTNSSAVVDNGNNRGFLGSVKSLYASLTRSTGRGQNNRKEKENRVSAANRAWFDDGTDPEPKAPPRKTRSQASSINGGGGGSYMQKNSRAYSHSSTNIPTSAMENKKIHTSNTTSRRRTGSSTSTSFETKGNRQWDIYSSKANREKSPSVSVTKQQGNEILTTSPTPQPTVTKRQSRQKSPLSFFSEKLGGNAKNQNKESIKTPATQSTIAASAASMARERQTRVERRRTMSSYDTPDGHDNRDPPRFEEDRQLRQRGQVRSRFFGQRDEDDSEAMDPEADDLRRMQRPAPDMRRLLLNNVNMSRSKSIGNDLDQKQPSVIRAI